MSDIDTLAVVLAQINRRIKAEREARRKQVKK
jgi:hypothetical protein